MKVDRAAVEHAERNRAARANAERIQELRGIVFRNAAHDHDVDALTNQAAAARMLASARSTEDNFLILGIVRVAIDNRWHQVVQAGIRHFQKHRHFSDHPVSARIQELWDLTTGRGAA